jgi:hypothetical protein
MIPAWAFNAKRLTGSRCGRVWRCFSPPLSSLRYDLARVENLSPSPKLVSTLSDSLALARRLLDDARKKFPELF